MVAGIAYGGSILTLNERPEFDGSGQIWSFSLAA